MDAVVVRRFAHYVPDKSTTRSRLVFETTLGLRVVSACWNKPELVLAVSPSLIASAMVITRVLLGDGNQRKLLHPLWSDTGLLRLIVETDDADEHLHTTPVVDRGTTITEPADILPLLAPVL